MALLIYYFTRHFNVELKIQPDIRLDTVSGIRPAPNIRYTAKSVSGASPIKGVTDTVFFLSFLPSFLLWEKID
jgi:hypothetical protein